jgi:hypothetical protein
LQGGVDNNLAFMFATGGTVSDRLTSMFHSANMGSGLYSLLVHVTGYNGMPDDPKVEVALYPSSGLAKDPCNSGNPTPMWNGSDVWPILDSATTLQGSGGGGGAGGGAPSCNTNFDIADAKFVDTNAYVTGNVLVASLPQAQLVFDSVASTVLVDITSVVLSARLEQVTGGWGLRDGTLAGIAEFEEMFRGIAELITSGQLVCTDNQLYNSIKTAVCQVPDITATLAGPTETCDAVSVGLGFTIADPITLGTVIPTPPGPGTCPMGLAPEDDGCENHF